MEAGTTRWFMAHSGLAPYNNGHVESTDADPQDVKRPGERCDGVLGSDAPRMPQVCPFILVADFALLYRCGS